MTDDVAGARRRARWRILARTNVFRIAKWLLGIAALYAVIRLDLIDIRAIVGQATNAGSLAAALGLVLLTLPLAALRWRLLLVDLGVDIGFGPTFDILAISYFAGLFLPGTSTDAVRIGYVLPAARGRRVAAVASIVIDRAFALGALLVLAALLSLRSTLTDRWPQGQWLALGVALGTLFVVGLASIAVLRKPAAMATPRGRLRDALRSLVRPFGHILRRPRLMLACFVLSLGIQASLLASIAIIGLSTELGGLGSRDYALAGAAAMLANLLPVTPGGIGVGEAAFAKMCELIANSPALAFGNVFLLYRAVSALVSLVGLLSFLRLGSLRVESKV